MCISRLRGVYEVRDHGSAKVSVFEDGSEARDHTEAKVSVSEDGDVPGMPKLVSLKMGMCPELAEGGDGFCPPLVELLRAVRTN